MKSSLTLSANVHSKVGRQRWFKGVQQGEVPLGHNLTQHYRLGHSDWKAAWEKRIRRFHGTKEKLDSPGYSCFVGALS